MAEVTIEARPNGPYIVNGAIELRDTNGNVLPTQARTVLCRCGASTKKPFCDGTHSKIGFQAAAQAVPDSAEKSQLGPVQNLSPSSRTRGPVGRPGVGTPVSRAANAAI
jgi:CDGSH-type Zn-finger protein